MRKFLVSVALAGLVFTGRFGLKLYQASQMPEEAPMDARAAAAETDAWIQESLQGGTSAPARGWLSKPGNALFEGEPEDVNALVETLHAAGAENVWFVDIDQIGKTNVSATIAARLPKDPAARARVLRVEAQYWQEEPQPDVGQRFVTFSFD